MNDTHSNFRGLSRPVIGDVREDFERKARELGFEPDTLLSSPLPCPAAAGATSQSEVPVDRGKDLDCLPNSSRGPSFGA